MSRLSSVLFGSVVVGIVATAAGCTGTLTVKSQDRFTEANYVLTDTQPWAGETVKIDIQGVPVSVNGGVTVIADLAVGAPITANARLLAMADTDDKPSADLSIGEVKNTFAISHGTAGEIDIACGHGSTHGSSDGGKSGCELVEIHVPTGSATQKISVTTSSGSGKMTLSFGSATIGTIGGAAKGAGCDIEATIPATLGGNVALNSVEAGDVLVHLPAGFSVDALDLEADPGQYDTAAFPDLDTAKFGGGQTQPHGTVGTGLATMKVTSTPFAGSSGKVTLSQ